MGTATLFRNETAGALGVGAVLGLNGLISASARTRSYLAVLESGRDRGARIRTSSSRGRCRTVSASCWRWPRSWGSPSCGPIAASACWEADGQSAEMERLPTGHRNREGSSRQHPDTPPPGVSGTPRAPAPDGQRGRWSPPGGGQDARTIPRSATAMRRQNRGGPGAPDVRNRGSHAAPAGRQDGGAHRIGAGRHAPSAWDAPGQTPAGMQNGRRWRKLGRALGTPPQERHR